MSKRLEQSHGLPGRAVTYRVTRGKSARSPRCLSDELLILCARIDFNP
jgi:hypothetical protein